jgi:hypothetical protein
MDEQRLKKRLPDSELLLLNQRGFIPGPSEKEEEFLNRIEHVKATFEEGGWIPRAHFDWVRSHLQEIYDFEPDCLPAFYSNRGLTFWQGAASWIEGRKIASVQLREGLRKGSYLGYSRDEILAHEAVHAARSAFDEPAFEEFFAFLTSEKWWRRAFGPIVQRPWEVWGLFVGLLAALVSPWGSFVGALWIGLGFLRLIRLHRKMRRAAKNLMAEVGSVKGTRAILVRLTDREIDLFSRGENLFAYAKQQKCLRWRLIHLAYLSNIGAR